MKVKGSFSEPIKLENKLEPYTPYNEEEYLKLLCEGLKIHVNDYFNIKGFITVEGLAWLLGSDEGPKGCRYV